MDQMLQVRVGEDFIALLDEWRRAQDDLPGRSEAIRRIGLDAFARAGVTPRRARPTKKKGADDETR